MPDARKTSVYHVKQYALKFGKRDLPRRNNLQADALRWLASVDLPPRIDDSPREENLARINQLFMILITAVERRKSSLAIPRFELGQPWLGIQDI